MIDIQQKIATFKRAKGVTLIELALTISMVGAILLILSTTFTAVLRKSDSFFNGDLQVQAALYNISDRLIMATSKVDIEKLNMVYDAPKNNKGQERLVAVLMPTYSDVNENSEDNDNTLSDTKPKQELYYIIFYYDPYGTINIDLQNGNREKKIGGFYEIQVHIDNNSSSNRTELSSIMTKDTLIQCIKSHKYHTRLLTANLCFFNIDMSRYPILTYTLAVRYGKGGRADRRAVIKDRKMEAYTEVFSLEFSTLVN